MPKKPVDPDIARGHRLAEKLIASRAQFLSPLGTPKPPTTLVITKQDFIDFCEAAVEGVRIQHPGDCEHETYWLCVGLCEATSNSNICTPFNHWEDVTTAIYERETK